MMVQTLVENAIKHGVAGLKTVAEVEVSACARSGGIEIRVADNGPGLDQEPRPAFAGKDRGGYGLKNIRSRLQGYYGDRAALEVFREENEGRTVAALRLPMTRDGGTKGGPS
jgi:two-component system sensor histidine kinase YesM